MRIMPTIRGPTVGPLSQKNSGAAASRAADAYIDRITFGRLQRGAPVDDAVRMAACAAGRSGRAVSDGTGQGASPGWPASTTTATARTTRVPPPI